MSVKDSNQNSQAKGIEEITFNCAHGTSNSRKNEILENGFNFGNGTCGKAVYFWTGIDDFSIDLAKYWVNLKKQNGQIDENEGSVIKCQIKVPKDSTLDLSSFEMVKAYSNFILKNGCKDLCALDETKRIALLKNFLETFIFENREKDYICYLTRHYIEINENLTFPVKILGHPFCLVVKSLKVISDDLKTSNFSISDKVI